MTKETKSDVFQKALSYVPVGSEYDWNNDQEAGNLGDKLLSQYNSALPDDLPTIPQKVSKEIKDAYNKYCLMDELNWANVHALPDDDVSAWVNNNESLFAEAWSRGLWVVEETREATNYED